MVEDLKGRLEWLVGRRQQQHHGKKDLLHLTEQEILDLIKKQFDEKKGEIEKLVRAMFDYRSCKMGEYGKPFKCTLDINACHALGA